MPTLIQNPLDSGSLFSRLYNGWECKRGKDVVRSRATRVRPAKGDLAGIAIAGRVLL